MHGFTVGCVRALSRKVYRGSGEGPARDRAQALRHLLLSAVDEHEGGGSERYPNHCASKCTRNGLVRASLEDAQLDILQQDLP